MPRPEWDTYALVHARIPVTHSLFRRYAAWTLCVYVERPEGAVEMPQFGGPLCFN